MRTRSAIDLVLLIDFNGGFGAHINALATPDTLLVSMVVRHAVSLGIDALGHDEEIVWAGVNAQFTPLASLQVYPDVKLLLHSVSTPYQRLP
jgi:hypothetical protein